MPLVTVPRPTAEQLQEISTRRWDDLRAARPDLAPAVDLQERLLTIVLSAARAIEGKLPRLSLNQEAIRQGAIHRGLAPDLVWLLAELAASPFAHALQTTLLTAPSESNHGYCAVCGSWPALAEFVDGHRTLRCSFCAAAWEMTDYCCIYCGETGENFKLA